MNAFHYVYRIRSLDHPDQIYTGQTDDLAGRMAKHNGGSVPHTSKYRPWEIEFAIALRDRSKAAAFARRHF